MLRRLVAEYAPQLKFVIADPNDLDEIEFMPGELGVGARSEGLNARRHRSRHLRERGEWIVKSVSRGVTASVPACMWTLGEPAQRIVADWELSLHVRLAKH